MMNTMVIVSDGFGITSKKVAYPVTVTDVLLYQIYYDYL